MESINIIGFLLMFYGAVMLLKIEHFKKAIIRWGAMILVALTFILASVYLVFVICLVGSLMFLYWGMCTIFMQKKEYLKTKTNIDAAMNRAYQIYPTLYKVIKQTIKYTK